jgi:TM2 domain-containing membrane protein YozV
MAGENKPEWVAALAEDRNRGERSRAIAAILSIALGYFGADRLYLRYWGLGTLKFFTLGAFGIWWLFDIVLILTDNMVDAEGNYLRRL